MTSILRRTAVAGGLSGLIAPGASAQTAPPQPSPESLKRPQKGDTLVFATGANAGKPIAPGDLPQGGPQQMAWAVDPASGTVRDGSRLNQVLLVRLADDSFAEPTRARAAAGVVAYSAICSHAQCPVTEWRQETGILHCACHNSEYDPRENAKVVSGPAPRSLAALPLGLNDGKLVVAGLFIGKVGAPTA
jgi:rieske iron-sulfur protein